MPFYWTFLPFFGYTARMPLFSRISPDGIEIFNLICPHPTFSNRKKPCQKIGLTHNYNINLGVVGFFIHKNCIYFLNILTDFIGFTFSCVCRTWYFWYCKICDVKGTSYILSNAPFPSQNFCSVFIELRRKSVHRVRFSVNWFIIG